MKTARNSIIWLVQRTAAVGGTRDIIDELAIRLSKRGLTAKVIYLREQQEAIAARRSKLSKAKATLKDTALLLKRLRKDRPALIVTFTPLLGSCLAPVASLLFNSRTIATHHTPISQMGALTRFLDRIVGSTRLYRSIITCAPGVMEEFSDYPPQYRKKLQLIPNGVDSQAFDSGNTQQNLRANHGLESTAPLALAVGRLSPDKNLGFLLRVLQKAPNWQLVVLGEGGQRPELESSALQLGISDRIRFLGARPKAEVQAWMETADAFVHPSKIEGLSLAILEAMSFGLPCLASDIPANQFPLQPWEDHSTGHLLPITSTPPWIQALNEIELNPEEALEMGRRARQAQQARFDKQTMFDRYVEEIESWL